MTPGTQRFAQIDELRGVAAVLVLITHASEIFAPYAASAGHSVLLSRIALGIDFGRIGVVLFFIISGFVVAHSLGTRGMTLARFAVRRAFRLFPLFWVSVMVAAWVAGTDRSVSTLLANLTMVPALIGFEPLLGVYWTLETELIFYAAAALLWSAGYLFRPAALLSIIAFLILVFAGLMFDVIPAARRLEWQSLPLNLAFMLWGALFHATRFSPPRATQDVALQQWLPWIATALVLAPSLYALARYFHSSSPSDLRWGVSYPTALGLFWIVCSSRHRSMEIIARLGVISYSIYLFHTFAVGLLVALLDSGGISSALAPLPVMVALALGVTVVIATVTYHGIERPFIAAARRLTSSPRRGTS